MLSEDSNTVTFLLLTLIGIYKNRCSVIYEPEGDVDYIEVNPATGELTYGEAFLQDLACWEETLTELIDPLVAEGYLKWTSLPEIGELFLEWEANCSDG